MATFLMAQGQPDQSSVLKLVRPIGSIRGSGMEIPVTMFDGLKPLLEQKDDKIYVINFWATWCKPCIEELPHFINLAGSYGENLEIVLVSLDFRSKAETDLIPFLVKHNVDLPVVLLSDADANAWIEKINPSWSGAIPATLIYCNDYRRFYETAFSMEELKAAIRSATL